MLAVYQTHIKRAITGNVLKIIAIAAMVFDHYAVVFLSHLETSHILLRLPGRIAAPIFCFLIAEGYTHTSDKKGYTMRMFILAVISHIPYVLYFGIDVFKATSIVWGLLLGLIVLSVLERQDLHWVTKVAIYGLCCVLAIPANWNFVAVSWIATFGLFRGNITRQILAFCAVGIFLYIIPHYLRFNMGESITGSLYQLGIFLSIPLLLLYNGARGAKSSLMKWGFYIFYPAHLLVLHMIHVSL